jgi:hypothetical protein
MNRVSIFNRQGHVCLVNTREFAKNIALSLLAVEVESDENETCALMYKTQ